jgi:hypothetical protein
MISRVKRITWDNRVFGVSAAFRVKQVTRNLCVRVVGGIPWERVTREAV